MPRNREERRRSGRPPLDWTGTAEYMGVSERHVRHLHYLKQLPYIKIGKVVRFDPDDLDMWLLEHRYEPTNGAA